MSFDLAHLGRGLPFAEAVPAVQQALTDRGVAVVQAAPGTGKTTLVPPVVANLSPGRVVVTGPRRVVVRAAARRLAELSGEPLGGSVGYTVRGERRVSGDTRVEFVTAGVLLRRLLSDPELNGVGAVVLDEVHERSLDTDLLVGMLAELRQLREDLRLVAMSATLDTAALQTLLGSGEVPAPVVAHEGMQHPLREIWAPVSGLRMDEHGVRPEFLDHVADVAIHHHRELLASQPGADALVFVPGAREVDRVVERAHRRAPDLDVVGLHGQVDARAQDRAVRGRQYPADPPRLVVSTSLAESSLTIPGVRLVIDAGLAREPRRDQRRDMSGLVTVQASRAAMTQRAGRAARHGPGVVVRCLEPSAFAHAPEYAPPEIVSADLTQTVLLLAAWGVHSAEGLALLTPPPAGALRAAQENLRVLGLVDDDGRITPTGRQAASIPVDARLGHALLAAAPLVGSRTAAEVVALLADDHRAADGDVSSLLREFRATSSRSSRWASSSRGASPASGAVARWRAEVDRLRGLVPAEQAAQGPGQATGPELEPAYRLGMVIALAYPDRVARREAGSYLLASGTRAALPPGSVLAQHEWIAVAQVARASGRVAAGTGAVIRLGAPLSREVAEFAADRLRHRELRASFTQGRVVAREIEAVGAIELSSTPVRPDPQAGAEAVAAALHRDGLGLLTWSPAADGLRRRLALLRHTLGEPWPEVTDEALVENITEWLGPELQQLAAGMPAARLDLMEPLRRLLPWPQAGRLEELVPQRLLVPSGSHIRIDYPPHDEPEARPVAAVKLQECFGLEDSPRLVEGRIPVLFHLLSPARRPLAITDDLASFWSGPYAQVRAEMRGRYPKHPWPEDPWTAPATARTTRAQKRSR